MSLWHPASALEYRYRAAILIISQPILGWLSWKALQFPGEWYAPEVQMPIGVIACTLGVIGVVMRIRASAFFTSYKVARRTAETDEIVDTGPFGSIRNPLYLGSLIQFAGYALFFGWIPAAIFTLLHAIRYQRIVLREEALFRERWGSRFDEYCSRVPRWIPRRPLPLLLGGWNSDAVFGNAPFIGITLGMLASLWTGNLLVLIPFEAAGFVVTGLYFLRQRWSVSVPVNAS